MVQTHSRMAQEMHIERTHMHNYSRRPARLVLIVNVQANPAAVDISYLAGRV